MRDFRPKTRDFEGFPRDFRPKMRDFEEFPREFQMFRLTIFIIASRVFKKDNSTASIPRLKLFTLYASISNRYFVIDRYFSSLPRITDGNVGWWTASGKPCVSRQIPKCFLKIGRASCRDRRQTC